MKKILCAALCLIICLGVLASCGGSGPEQVFEKLKKAVDSKDPKLMLELFEPAIQEVYKSLMGDNLDALLEDYEDDEGKPVDMKLDKVEYTDDAKTKAKLFMTATVDGESDSTEMPVKLVDGNWYLDMGGMLG